ncbi:hypothetical protein CTI12_AA064110 [Artemisia annua]|uniref:RRM domain-containing protein n=1 Tax=Artemisia annua TaxID=35608 RepID=A0A2U1Q841_ARTAN|nr:hypothetical protein CTI12_AA064110 [Artemisia annua]
MEAEKGYKKAATKDEYEWQQRSYPKINHNCVRKKIEAEKGYKKAATKDEYEWVKVTRKHRGPVNKDYLGEEFHNYYKPAVVDHNGWTWTFRNHNNQKEKPIPFPYAKEVDRVATSFYVTNFPDHLDAKGLWKLCEPFGCIVDAFIANKISKIGKRFGFVRFKGVLDADVFVKSLANIWIGNFHVYFAVARFQRQYNLGPHSQNTPQTAPKQSTNWVKENTNIQATNRTAKSQEKASYASAVHGNHSSKASSSTENKVLSLTLNEQDLIKVEDTTKVVLAKVKNVETMSSIHRLCRNEGFDNLKIHHIGGLWIWISFVNAESCVAFKRNKAMQNLCSAFKTVSPNFCVDERMIWVEISGLPLCAWGSNAFKKVASVFGKFMFFEVDQTSSMSTGRICISTRHTHFLSTDVQVLINGETFLVHVHELGSWSINIEDDQASDTQEAEYKDEVSTSDSDEVGFGRTLGRLFTKKGYRGRGKCIILERR